MAKIIANLDDGRVVPWFSEDPVPASFVVVPDRLLAKYAAGKIADGVALAKAALAGDVGEPSKPAKAPGKAETKLAEATAGGDSSFGGATFA